MTHPKKTTARVLPAKPEEAMTMMIRVTDDLIRVMEEEARRLAAHMDAASLRGLEETKTKSARAYHAAAVEFHARLEEFRKVGGDLLDRLEDAQHRLGTLTRTNNAQIEPMTEKN